MRDSIGRRVRIASTKTSSAGRAETNVGSATRMPLRLTSKSYIMQRIGPGRHVAGEDDHDHTSDPMGVGVWA